jgi:hypothetical protein
VGSKYLLEVLVWNCERHARTNAGNVRSRVCAILVAASGRDVQPPHENLSPAVLIRVLDSNLSSRRNSYAPGPTITGAEPGWAMSVHRGAKSECIERLDRGCSTTEKRSEQLSRRMQEAAVAVLDEVRDRVDRWKGSNYVGIAGHSYKEYQCVSPL